MWDLFLKKIGIAYSYKAKKNKIHLNSAVDTTLPLLLLPL